MTGAKPGFTTVTPIVPAPVAIAIDPEASGTVGSPGHDDLGIRDGLSGRTHLDANGSGRSLSGLDGCGRTDDQT